MFTDQVLQTLELQARNVLATALSSLPGSKTLLVDDTLYDPHLSVARPLDLFTDTTYLQEHGIRSTHPLSSTSSSTLTTQIVIIIRGINAQAARQAVNTIRETKDDTKVMILMTPRKSILVEKVMKLSGVYNDIIMNVLEWGFFPFDTDCISLDWPLTYKQITLEGDNSALLATSNAIHQLSNIMNLNFDIIRSVGNAATAVVEQLLQTSHYSYDDNKNIFSPEHAFKIPPIDDDDLNINQNQQHQQTQEYQKRKVTLILIDRGVDIVTPLLTQWTYEGLLDESVGLHNNTLDLPISSIISPDALNILQSSNTTTQPSTSALTIRKRLRTKDDKIFSQLRDLNYWSAARHISSIASSVRLYYASRPNKENSEISTMKDYVRGLRQVKSEHASATAHTALAAEVAARTFDSLEFKGRFEVEREMVEGGVGGENSRRVFITDCIARGESLSRVLRICCVWSLTSGGIQSDDLEIVKREMVANYGLGVLGVIANLERAGLMGRAIDRNNGGGSGSSGGGGGGGGGGGSSGSGGSGGGISSWISIPGLGGGNAMDNSKNVKTSNIITINNNTRPSTTENNTTQTPSPSPSSTTTSTTTSTPTPTRQSPIHQPQRQPQIRSEYSWQFSRAALRLVTDFDPEREVRPGSSAAMSAPYSGYTPLTARLTEAGLSEDGWNSLPHLPSHHSLLPPGHVPLEHRNKKSVNSLAVIVIVGGAVRAEISAIRMAAKAAGVKTVIATTAVMGPDEFVLSMK